MAGRYYWLKLNENFFESDVVEWLEDQENGEKYVLLYLKLCLKSLKTDGALVRQVGKMTIQHTAESIAKQTQFDIEIVESALDLFEQIGLIEKNDKGENYLPEVANMTGSGSASESATKKKTQRQNKKGQNVPKSGDKMSPEKETKCPTEIRDKSIEYRDKEKDDYYHPKRNDDDEEKTHTEIFALWEKNMMPLTPIVGEKLQALLGEVGEAAVEQGILAAVEHGARNFAYVQTVARNYAGGNSKKQGRNDYTGMDLVNELYGGEEDAATAENSPNDC
ncbi:phage replisome organizer N-terminal domain-containing protein [Phascolarctobacterium succinatutens]|uniref:phage replisome organizer N-terminal domain-containing protein n=1 Tax=Phascolarctobacterium succinatutens TaxID=626940 RepID=UPI003FD7621C